jgi:hypothetical protein
MTICYQCIGAKATQGTEDILSDSGASMPANPVQGAIPCSACNGVGYY